MMARVVATSVTVNAVQSFTSIVASNVLVPVAK
jgi:hypothetical protein